MTNTSSSLNLERKESLCQQIAQHIRAMVAGGEWGPGDQLPATLALAEMWKAAPHTVHRALVILEREGLVTRRHGIGTFVRKREQRLTCAGIYFREDVLATHSSDFQRMLHAAIKAELNRSGVRTQVWVDPRTEAEQAAPWRALCEAVERREIQGLIVPNIDWPRLQWLQKLPIPSAFATCANIPNRMDSDIEQLAESSLRCLAKQGCRSVGFIGPVELTAESDEEGAHNHNLAFFERFTNTAADLGLTMKDSWMRVPQSVRSDLSREGKSQAQFGYEEVLKLLNQPERPEGLLVYPDTTARGVILGLQEKQVRVPEDMKLVLHKNESIPLLCPMPATFAVLSERACARALIEQVQKQFRGEPCEPIIVGFTLSSAKNKKKS